MYKNSRIAAAAAAIFLLVGFGGTSLPAATAAELVMVPEAGAADQGESLWIALRPADDQPFTF